MSLSGVSLMQMYAEALLKLRELPHDWDSYGGVPANTEVVVAVAAFLRAVVTGNAALVPLADGGIQIEVHRDGWDFEVEVERPKEGEPMHGIGGVYQRVNRDD